MGARAVPLRQTIRGARAAKGVRGDVVGDRYEALTALGLRVLVVAAP